MVLIWVLAIQRVYGYLKPVKHLFIEALIAYIMVDIMDIIILLAGRVSPFDEMTTIIVYRLVDSLSLFSVAVMGYAATIIYKKPKSYSWKDISAEIVGGGKIFLPFLFFIFIILSLFILTWIAPIRVELEAYWPYPNLYVPVLETEQLIIYTIAFIAFLLYPATVFLLASYATENKTVSRNLRIFAICVIALAVSDYLQGFIIHAAEMVEIIRIPCFMAIMYAFRRMTALQDFKEVELGEYIARLRQRPSNRLKTRLLLSQLYANKFIGWF